MTWKKDYKEKLKEQKKMSKDFSDKFDYYNDTPIKISHVNPDCDCHLNGYKEHGETSRDERGRFKKATFAGEPCGSIWIARPDFKAIKKRIERERWMFSLAWAVLIGCLIGLLIS